MEGIRQFNQLLNSRGFTVVAVNTSVYNTVYPPIDGNALLIGNTSSLWPLLSEWRREYSGANPVDDYTRETISMALPLLSMSSENKVVYTTDKPYRVSFQQLGHLGGVSYYCSSCGLCLDPEVGPWFAMRALVPIPDDVRLSTLPNPLSMDQERVLSTQFKSLLVKSYPSGWIDLRRQAAAFTHSTPSEYPSEMIRHHYGLS